MDFLGVYPIKLPPSAIYLYYYYYYYRYCRRNDRLNRVSKAGAWLDHVVLIGVGQKNRYSGLQRVWYCSAAGWSVSLSTAL